MRELQLIRSGRLAWHEVPSRHCRSRPTRSCVRSSPARCDGDTAADPPPGLARPTAGHGGRRDRPGRRLHLREGSVQGAVRDRPRVRRGGHRGRRAGGDARARGRRGRPVGGVVRHLRAVSARPDLQVHHHAPAHARGVRLRARERPVGRHGRRPVPRAVRRSHARAGPARHPRLRVAAAGDNLADAWRAVVPPLRARTGGRVLVLGGGARASASTRPGSRSRTAPRRGLRRRRRCDGGGSRSRSARRPRARPRAAPTTSSSRRRPRRPAFAAPSARSPPAACARRSATTSPPARACR